MQGRKSLKELVTRGVERAGLRLPVFAPVAMELQRVLGDDNASAESVEKILMKDPALVGEVLRMANSSAFAGLSRIDTLRHALLRLGVRQVARLAIASAQLSLYKSHNPLLSHRMELLWRESYASAVAAGWIAERAGYPELASSAFLAGLLHDIGKLVVIKVIEDVISDNPNGFEFSEDLIDEMLDTLHCDTGYALMQRWNLPESYGIVARDHHKENAGPGSTLLAVVRLAGSVCDHLGISSYKGPAVQPAATPEATDLGLSEVRLAELEVKLEDLLVMPAAAG